MDVSAGQTGYPTDGARFYAEHGKSVSQAVLDDGFAGDPCESFAGLMHNRALNTGGGRPSDAARYVVRLHTSLGCKGFRARYEQGANARTLDAASWSLIGA